MKKMFSKPYLKKTLSIIFGCLAFLGLAIGLPVGLVPEKEESKAETYNISDADDWNDLAWEVHQGWISDIEEINIEGDIEGILYQMGTVDNPLNGVAINGGGYTIYPEYLLDPNGECATMGLFGGLYSCQVYGLNIYYPSDYYVAINTDWFPVEEYVYFGGAIGYAEDTYVSGCYVTYSGLVLEGLSLDTFPRTFSFGGIIGGAYDCYIDDCETYGENVHVMGLRGDYNCLGGVVGWFYSSDSRLCYDITNEADLNFDGYGYTYAGGVFGYYNGTAANELREIRNYGDIICQSCHCAGGLIGYANTFSMMESSFNYGTIFSFSGMYLGGLFGSFNGEMLSNCANVGTLNFYAGGDNACVGGLIGCLDTASIHGAELSDCYNSGVFEEIESNSCIVYVGGIITLSPSLAYTGYALTLTRCINTGYPNSDDYSQSAYLVCNYEVSTSKVPVNLINCVAIDEGYGSWYSENGSDYTCGYYNTISGCHNGGEGLDTVGFYTTPSNWNSSYMFDMNKVWGIPKDESYGLYPILRDIYKGLSYKVDGYEFSGNGTSSSPYLISTSADLKGLAENVNKGLFTYTGQYFRLSKDITLTGVWTPIGNSSTYYFAGTFDGNSKKINGLYINNITANYQALFGYTKGATIKNVSMTNLYIKAHYYVAGIVGYGTGTKISNCSVKGTIYTDSTSNGGIVGYLNGSSSSGAAYIENCHNEAKIIGLGSIGGIVGQFLPGSSSTYIKNCTNSGTIVLADSVAGSTGGNKAGGIVGVVQDSGSLVISNCYNKGNFELTSLSYNVGGIAGSDLASTLTLNSCYNTGSISGGFSYLGGFVGQSSTGSLIINKSYHSGDIIGEKWIAGIAGYAYSLTATDCAIYGRVTGNNTENVGGFIGRAKTASTLTNCSFVGTTYVNAKLHGSASDAKPTYSGCYFISENYKYYTSGDFSAYTIMTNMNNGYPMQNNIFSIAIGGNTSTDVINNLKNKGCVLYS